MIHLGKQNPVTLHKHRHLVYTRETGRGERVAKMSAYLIQYCDWENWQHGLRGFLLLFVVNKANINVDHTHSFFIEVTLYLLAHAETTCTVAGYEEE